MSLQRLRSPYTSQTSVGTGFVGPAAEFSDGAGDMFSIHEFEGDGTGGTNVGQMYKVFQWKNTVDESNYSDWVTDPTTYLGGNGLVTCTLGGYADVLLCGAGGGGGGAYKTASSGSNNYAGGGGGGGGVIVKFNIKFDEDRLNPYSIFAGAAGQKASITGAQPQEGQPSWIKRPNGVTMYEAFGGCPGQTAWGSPPGSAHMDGNFGSGGGNATLQGDSTTTLTVPYKGSWTPGQGHKGGSGSYSSQASGGGGGYMGAGANGGRQTTAVTTETSNWPGNGGDGLTIRFNGAENHHGYGPGGGGATYNSGRVGIGGAGGGMSGLYNGNGALLNTSDEFGFGAGGGGIGIPSGDHNRRGHNGVAGIVMIRIPI